MAKRGRRKGQRRSFGRRPPRIVLHIRADQPIEYKDVELLRKCLGSQGQILSRRRTGLSSKRQRELKEAIKRARHVALVPFVA